MNSMISTASAEARGRALETWLFEVPPADAASIAAAAIGFGVIALAASLLPALRASRTDLVSALHHE